MVVYSRGYLFHGRFLGCSITGLGGVVWVLTFWDEGILMRGGLRHVF